MINLLSSGFASPTAIIIYASIIAISIIVLTFLVVSKSQKDEIAEKTGKEHDTNKPSNSQEGSDTAQNGNSAKNADGKQMPSTRFFGLKEIDANKSLYKRSSYGQVASLKDLCEDFRNFAASRLRLYYSIDDIRRFIAGMAVSKLLILQGMSGTGKTSLAYAFGEYIDNTSTVIPVQPMWKDRSDLLGYYNEFTKKFNETPLLKKMYEANYSDDMYVTVLDEMNIARAEYYFAEFLSLLELPNPEDRYLTVVTDKWKTDPVNLKNGLIKLPTNMWFIGTANNDDSTFAISDKIYDRAMVLNLDQKSEKFIGEKVDKAHISVDYFNSLVEEATQEYHLTERSLRKISKLDEYLIENFHLTFGNRIMKQINTYIPVYVACGGKEIDAIDDIISKKVIRKLETQNPVYIRNSAEGLISKLTELFGEGEMTICKEHVKVIARNA